jgi:hypothetical protein
MEMSPIMKFRTISFVALAIPLLACGDSGSKPTEITTEHVSAYDPDNPCDGNAIRLTITAPKDEPVVEYLCQGLDDHVVPEVDEFIAAYLGMLRPEIEYDCNCLEMGPSPAECDAARLELQVMGTYLSRCSNEALILFGEEPPPEIYEFFECLGAAANEYVACMGLADFELCDGFEEASACVEMATGLESCYGVVAADDEATAWFDFYIEVLGYIGCDLF